MRRPVPPSRGGAGDEPPDEPMSGATELVRQGHAIMRIENETMLRVSIERPRDEQKILQKALAELEIVPEFAKQAFYSIPHKERVAGGGERLVYVTGQSIGAATALARLWGNCDCSARPINEDDEGFDVEGVFVDFETNFRVRKPGRVSKYYKPHGSRTVVKLREDRLIMALQAGFSKAMRNAILAGLPKYLTLAHFTKARSIVAGGDLDKPADPKKIEGAISAFARRFNVTGDPKYADMKPDEKIAATRPLLEKYVELPAAQWTGEQIAELQGLYTSLIDNQLSVEEAFRRDDPERQEDKPGDVRPENLTGGDAEGKDGAHPTAESAGTKKTEPEPESKGTVVAIAPELVERTVTEWCAALGAVETMPKLNELYGEMTNSDVWPHTNQEQRDRIRKAKDAAVSRIAAAASKKK